MTRQTSAAKIRDAVRRRRQCVRIVARNTAEFGVARALLETLARVHLLDGADKFVARSVVTWPNEIGDEAIQGQSRTKIEFGSPAHEYARFALEMALLAHRLAKRRLQMSRIDDRGIDRARRFASRLPGDVQFAGTVAPLAADCVTMKNGRPIAIGGMTGRLSLIAVARQASRNDRPAHVLVVLVVARRQIPETLEWIPGDRGLKR